MPILRARPSQLLSKPQEIAITDLSGGLDLRTIASRMAASRTLRCENWRTDEPGALAVARGTLGFMDSAGAGRIQGGVRAYLDAGTVLVIAIGGELFHVADNGTQGAAVATGLHATNPIAFMYDHDRVVAMDGNGNPRHSEDGDDWFRLGIAAPAAPSVSAVAGGSLTDTSEYGFSYAYRDANGFTSNESPEDTITIAAPNQTARVAVVASADPQVTQIVVYARDITAGEDVRRETDVVANANANVDVAADNWETADEAETTNDPAEPLAFGVYWKGRFWAIDATVHTRLRFGQLFLGMAWPANFFVDLPFLRGDECQAMIPIGDMLVLFGKTSIIALLGSSSLDFDVRQVIGPRDGALGANAVCEVDGRALHAGITGVYLFDGSSDRLLTHDLDTVWRDLIRASTAANLLRLPATYHGLFKEVRIGVPRVYPHTSPGELILDLTSSDARTYPVWRTGRQSVGGYIPWQGDEALAADFDRLLAWPIETLSLVELNVGTTIDGADQVAVFETADFALPRLVGRFLELHVEFETAPGSFTVEILINQRLTVSIPIPILLAGAQYGTFTYGQQKYGGRQYRVVPVDLPLDAEGQLIRMRGTYSGKRTFRLLGLTIPTVPEPAIRGIV